MGSRRINLCRPLIEMGFLQKIFLITFIGRLIPKISRIESHMGQATEEKDSIVLF